MKTTTLTNLTKPLKTKRTQLGVDPGRVRTPKPPGVGIGPVKTSGRMAKPVGKPMPFKVK